MHKAIGKQPMAFIFIVFHNLFYKFFNAGCNQSARHFAHRRIAMATVIILQAERRTFGTGLIIRTVYTFCPVYNL